MGITIKPEGNYAHMTIGKYKLKIYFAENSGFNYDEWMGSIYCNIFPVDTPYNCLTDRWFDEINQDQRSITLSSNYFVCTDIAGNLDLFMFGRLDPMDGLVVDFSILKEYIEKIIDAETGEILWPKS